VSQRNLSSASGGLWVVGRGSPGGFPWASLSGTIVLDRLVIYISIRHPHTSFIPSSLLISPTLAHSFRFSLSLSHSSPSPSSLVFSFFFFPRLLLRLFKIIRLVQDLIYHPISCIYYHNDRNEQKTSHHHITSSSSHRLIISSSHRRKRRKRRIVDIPLMDQPNDPIELGISSDMDLPMIFLIFNTTTTRCFIFKSSCPRSRIRPCIRIQRPPVRLDEHTGTSNPV
jgi:hypothetical protein